jgi:Fe-S-cluster containining protein
VERLARFLRIPRRQFLAEYTAQSADGSRILRKTPAGCVFLNGNDCTVYEARPADCERYPHLLRGTGSIPFRMWAMVDRAGVCPIVYNWLETVKSLTNFRP